MSSSSIYTGAWVNQNVGNVLGATLTLSRRDGGFLTIFIATFITVVGAQLWYIITFIFHQIRASNGVKDGLHHQQQNILRNTATPAGASRLFIEQIWHWRGRTSRLLLRTLPLALFSIAYILVLTAAAILSSKISEFPGSARLVKGASCGNWQAVESMRSNRVTLGSYEQKIANASIIASAYSRSCYGDNPSALSCGVLPRPSLKWTSMTKAACPFREDVCIGGSKAALQMDTNSLYSVADLGINVAKSAEVRFRLRTTCSPIEARQFLRRLQGAESRALGYSNSTTLHQYNYGPMIIDGIPRNYTYLYNAEARYTDSGYTLEARYAFPNTTAPWRVHGSLAQDDADLSMVFVASNSVIFLESYDDPVFGAKQSFRVGEDSFYLSDKFVVPIACAEQRQVCNPLNGRCTQFVGRTQLGPAVVSPRLGLNVHQIEVVARLSFASFFTSIYHTVNNRGSAALLASDLIAGVKQYPLRPNQWIRECQSWFTTGLAQFQHAIHEYAAGPTNLGPGLEVSPPLSAFEKSMCENQIVHNSQDTTSFSILGLIIVFVLGGAILVVSFCIDIVVGAIQTRWKKGQYKKLSWVMGDKLVLQRQIFLLQGLGVWDTTESWPITVKGTQAFKSWEMTETNGHGIITTNDEIPQNVETTKKLVADATVKIESTTAV